MIERLSWRALLPFSTAAPISAQSSSPPAVQGEFRTGSPGRGWSTSRAIGDPGVTRGLGLALVQVIF